MKTFYTFTLVIIIALSSNAQPFNFYGNIYFESADEVPGVGSTLIYSGTSLSSFNYNNAPSDHPLLNEGVFYPVQDCSNQNIWVRVQHIAADPNGTENGHSISQSMNSPFLPSGSTDRIGGWNGFLYEFQIFQDQVLNGTRSNVLGDLFPTNITVASLETLYNDGGSMFEWLSFNILNSESAGWYLNSTNFTGINPMSTPGFSADLHYATTGTSSSAPIGFSTVFPDGSANIYAVDMNLSASFHSEFKMTATSVSKFRYGYEFHPGGYQGMSMEFGAAPILNVNVVPTCGLSNGFIGASALGTEPFVYEWDNGSDQNYLDNIPAGDYTLTVTDANGCSTTQMMTIAQFDSLEVTIDVEFLNDTYLLEAIAVGGTPGYTYSWSTGETNSFIEVIQSGAFSVVVADANGCETGAYLDVVSVDEKNIHSSVGFGPNPVQRSARFYFDGNAKELRIMELNGKLMTSFNVQNMQSHEVELSNFPDGVYFYQITQENSKVFSGKMVVQK